MAFPQDRRSIYAELFVNDAWTDITSDIKQSNGINLVRGYRNEAGRAELTSCGMTFKNRSGNYSPRNPSGAYSGSFGQNTPVRLGIGPSINDLFTRTVSNGWGSTPTGEAWVGTGLGGAVLASDFAVNGTAATHSVPTTTAYRISYLSTTSFRDIEVTADVSLSFTNVTGGDLEPANIVLRGQSTTNYYMVRIVITTAEAITIKLTHFNGTDITSAVTTSLTHASGQTLRVKAQAEGQTLRAKVWSAAGSEPYGWDVVGHSELINDAGWVGIRNGVAAGNTNTKPIIFTVDNYKVRAPRFAGELGEIRAQWDTSGEDITAEIEASGPMRRLGQGQTDVLSTMRRALTSATASSVVACWPMEDSVGSTVIAAAVGTSSMFVIGPIQFAANEDFDCAGALPVMNGAHTIGGISPYTPSTGTMIRFLLSVPTAGVAVESVLIRVSTNGTIRRWELSVNTAGSLRLQAFTVADASVYDSGFIGFAVNGSPRQVSIDFTQNGANIDHSFATLEPGSSVGSFTAASTAGQTCGIANNVILNPGGLLDNETIGFVSVHSTVESISVVSDQLAAWNGETACNRVIRLCEEESVPIGYVGDADDSVQMGVQRPSTLMDLLEDCATADMGLLYESKGEAGIHYRTRASMYNQDVRLDLDYGNNIISQPFVPVDDDQLICNDVTVRREGGSEARSVLETGPMSVLPPDQGGKGRYAKPFTLKVYSDDQLPHLAGWIRHLSTVDETRYPQVTVDLSRAGVIAAGIEEDLLSLVLGDRLTISNPKAGQTPDQISQLAIGYAETLNAFVHTLTLVCVPESPYRVLELNSGDDDSRLNSNSSTLTANITSSATSFQVTTGNPGDLWITTATFPTHFPVLIRIGGEILSVGAITGTTSPQTFSTITRSINGVVLGHTAGDTVNVANPVVLPL